MSSNDRRIHENLRTHAELMSQFIADDMSVEAASKEALRVMKERSRERLNRRARRSVHDMGAQEAAETFGTSEIDEAQAIQDECARASA